MIEYPGKFNSDGDTRWGVGVFDRKHFASGVLGDLVGLASDEHREMQPLKRCHVQPGEICEAFLCGANDAAQLRVAAEEHMPIERAVPGIGGTLAMSPAVDELFRK